MVANITDISKIIEDEASTFQEAISQNLNGRFGSIKEGEVNSRRAEYVLNRTSVEGSDMIEIDLENQQSFSPKESSARFGSNSNGRPGTDRDSNSMVGGMKIPNRIQMFGNQSSNSARDKYRKRSVELTSGKPGVRRPEASGESSRTNSSRSSINSEVKRRLGKNIFTKKLTRKNIESKIILRNISESVQED